MKFRCLPEPRVVIAVPRGGCSPRRLSQMAASSILSSGSCPCACIRNPPKTAHALAGISCSSARRTLARTDPSAVGPGAAGSGHSAGGRPARPFCPRRRRPSCASGSPRPRRSRGHWGHQEVPRASSPACPGHAVGRPRVGCAGGVSRAKAPSRLWAWRPQRRRGALGGADPRDDGCRRKRMCHWRASGFKLTRLPPAS